MKFTDLFIRRPVLATVISLIILLLGLNSINKLELRQYPKIQTSQITTISSAKISTMPPKEKSIVFGKRVRQASGMCMV